MRTRFLLGPGGSGKTFRCLAEIRSALKESPEGAPLILIAPKQATFQLERQLLSAGDLSGYTRLQILSFERLADFILADLRCAPTKILSEEGRVMVLRALLLRNKEKLKIFHSSARMPGFAQQLSLLLRELQRHKISSATLQKLSGKIESQLSAKLHDLALLLDAYFVWLKENELHDANSLLDLATEALRSNQSSSQPAKIAGLWMDGFAEMTPQETDLLAAILPNCEQATLAFCTDPTDSSNSALSIWSVVNRTVQQCRGRIEQLPGCVVEIEPLHRDKSKSRFSETEPLAHLERHWTKPIPFEAPAENALRIAVCSNPEAEATLAAQEILRFVRSGGRFRNVAVLLRAFEGYHAVLRRVFARYDIPFFLDRRESIAHHPLAELTRATVRLATFNWENDDLFGALKTGLVVADETSIDRLENEALANGWQNEAWLAPLSFHDPAKSDASLERLRQRIIPPFQEFCDSMSVDRFSPTGNQLAESILALWKDLDVEQKLESLSAANPVHATVWEQMQEWLANIRIAFGDEAMRLNEWLPVLESGLSGLTVGAIPPALDQVLIGTIDRSRNPDLELALVLGMNESIFPASPSTGTLLTADDKEELSKHEIALGPGRMELLGRERFYGYIACTRARKRLVATCAMEDTSGRSQNPSTFLSTLGQLFPGVAHETFSTQREWFQNEHSSELMSPLIKATASDGSRQLTELSSALPEPLRKRIHHFAMLPSNETLSPEAAERLYGTTLNTSVSALEQFAACPFRFFVSAGLRARERKVFEADVRERGSFQHAILAGFHEQLRIERKRWRDISAKEARERIEEIGEQQLKSFRNGLFARDPENAFSARGMIASLQDFIEATVGWMQQYEFDPHAVELGFGVAERTLPPWEIDLGNNRKIAFGGIIDRIDICKIAGGDEALAVVIDYKSSAKRLDALALKHGLQLQLPAYLAFLRRLPDASKVFDASRLVPAGVFYVNLRGEFKGGKTRDEILENLGESRVNAFRHSGRFDAAALSKLDNRGASQGTQFNYRLKQNGEPHGASQEILRTEDFQKLLDSVEENLVRMGNEIFAGNTKIDPYQKGTTRACDQCDYKSICRIDPWTHQYRILK